MKKIISIIAFCGMFFLASCGGGTPRTEEPENRDTVMIIDQDTDTVPAAPAPTP